MTSRLPLALFLVIASSSCCAQTPIDVQPVKELDRSTNLATCDYRPTPKEAPFYKRLSASEQATGSTTAEYSIRGKQGRYVSWSGVVRGVAAAKPGASTLLLEQKAFDGFTDCHIMLVSFAGSGDFRATFVPGRETIQPLSLVRIYGRVTGEINGMPEVSAEYLRVWPWMTFTFTDLGPKNSGNPEWTKLCQLCKPGERIYNPFPDRRYYTLTLGEPQEKPIAPVSYQPGARSPAGGAGFLFSSFPIMPPRLGLPSTAIVSRYLPPQDSIRLIWQKFNNRDIRILASKPDAETAGQCVAQIGKRCETADVQLSWVSPKGAACIGSFMVLNALPGFTGDWFSIVAGIWGPSDEMARSLPLLEKVAESFSINDRYAQRYVQQGMDNLRVLQAQTQHSINRLYEAIDDNQRDWERRSASQDRSAAGWSDSMRGNSYWISDLEGGKVYATDPWGTEDASTHDRVEGAPYHYINFESQNPRFPSENMREISIYDLQHMQ